MRILRPITEKLGVHRLGGPSIVGVGGVTDENRQAPRGVGRDLDRWRIHRDDQNHVEA